MEIKNISPRYLGINDNYKCHQWWNYSLAFFLSLIFSGIIVAVNRWWNYSLAFFLSLIFSGVIVIINTKQKWESYYGQWESSLPEYSGKSAPSPVCLSHAHIYISAYSRSVTYIYKYHAYYIVTIYRSAIYQWQGYTVPVKQSITYNFVPLPTYSSRVLSYSITESLSV